MARSGRKPKTKPGQQRYPNGRIKPTMERLNNMAALQRQQEQAIVLAQPHRRGNDHKWAESPIGRLGLRHRLHEALVEAGLEYGQTVRTWTKIWGGPQEPGVPQTGRGGEGPTTDQMAKTRRETVRLEREVIREAGMEALIGIRQLVLSVYDIAPEQDHDTIIGLHTLAVETGRMPKTRHPFAAS